MKKTILLIFALAVILVVGGIVYFVSGITEVSPVVKKYEFVGNINELILGIRQFADGNPQVVFSMGDTAGYGKLRLRGLMKVEIKNGGTAIEYDLACQKSQDNNGSSVVDIDITGVYDKLNHIGGYTSGIKEVEPLIQVFEIAFVAPLQKKQGVFLIAQK